MKSKSILLVSLLVASPAMPQSTLPQSSIAKKPAHVAAAAQAPRASSPYSAAAHSEHAANVYQTFWGVDSMAVRAVYSDQLIRFSYRVVNAAKAKTLNAKEAAPQLIDEASQVYLVVPTMDKIGQLRQSGPPENGKTYWMVFSNKGNVVKRGHRVSVVIGEFRADGLAVE